ncbi:MAG: NAD(P)H-dependent oxidoreductase subunit E [Planctomycetes bacterium]|nr:NAD(P)H-dependent oxidoreductase subunit E [Planctomycetota bacterium]MBU4400680.1 NAD(P)H-dependent oxidoreductase subunit E [Planctomycetota bacterium]
MNVLDAEVRKNIERCLGRYPTKQAATLPALHLVNDRLGYVPPKAVVEIAELLELAPAWVQDTLSFYEFFKQDKPQGKYRVWVCRSIGCAARGGEDLLEYLCEKLKISPGETTADGRVTLEYAECLGVCELAPAILVNDTLHGNMTMEKIDELVDQMSNDQGSMSNDQGSMSNDQCSMSNDQCSM